MTNKLLVTGAAGQLGQNVLKHLLDTIGIKANQIIATSRTPDALSALAARGVEVRHANFDDASTLNKAFAGADRLLLISTDALDRPGRRLAQQLAAVRAAEQVGVRHVVYTSMPNADRATVVVAPDHAQTEAALNTSSLPGWTVLRNHWYFENLYMTLPAILRNNGQWFHAAGDGRLANISREDLALAAAIVLAGEGQGKQVFTLSGEESLTTAEQARFISLALDRNIIPVPLPEQALLQGMLSSGVPEPLARIFASFDANTAAGFIGDVSMDYRRITGKAPQPFASWLLANRARIKQMVP